MMAGMTCQMFAGYFVDILLVWDSVVNLAGGTSWHEGVAIERRHAQRVSEVRASRHRGHQNSDYIIV